jgi:hypothetical protein
MLLKRLPVAVLAGLVGSGLFAGSASALPEVGVQFRLGVGALDDIFIPRGGTATLDVVLSTDVPLVAAAFSVGLSGDEAVEILSAANTPPSALVPHSFSSGAPNGPTGRFGGIAPFGSTLAPGVYYLGSVTFEAVKTGMVTVSTVFQPGLDGLILEDLTQYTPLVEIATIEVVAGSVGGAAIDTPPLHIGSGGDPNVSVARCYLANHGDKEVVVSDARILDQNGNVAAGNGFGLTVAPGAARPLIHAAVQQGFCRVRGKFSKRSVQVTFCAIGSGSNDGACLEAVSAP